MQFLYFLEKLRVPGLNEFMLAITTLGEETAFLVIGLIVFWCVSKRLGYYVMGVGFAGNIASQAMKIACRVPRPWVLDENFTILEQAREAASGYSFPSGHTQSAVGTFGAIARATRKKWLAAVCIVLAALVGISRMYIGVHTPADVLVGAAISVLFVLVLYPLMMGKEDRTYPVLLALLAVSVVYLVVLEAVTFPADTDPDNLHSAIKNAYTFVGCMLGLAVVYPMEKRFINFDVKAPWLGQVLKAVLGLAGGSGGKRRPQKPSGSSLRGPSGRPGGAVFPHRHHSRPPVAHDLPVFLRAGEKMIGALTILSVILRPKDLLTFDTREFLPFGQNDILY